MSRLQVHYPLSLRPETPRGGRPQIDGPLGHLLPDECLGVVQLAGYCAQDLYQIVPVDHRLWDRALPITSRQTPPKNRGVSSGGGVKAGVHQPWGQPRGLL